MKRSVGWLALLSLAWLPPTGLGQVTAVVARIPDPYEDVYRGYQVDWRAADPESMRLSSEKVFFTLNLLAESDRAYALVEAAIEKEQAGQFREATEIYQKVIDEHPDMLYRVSAYGVFVPVVHYCQLRLLGFPPEALQAYRVRHDARAKESYELAARKNSLEGLAQVRDSMLATSYGAPSLMTLGYTALDRGNFLEALEYFQTTWAYYPEVRKKNPRLSMSMELCRKVLGQGAASGEQGPVGYWKLDETSGTRAADSAAYGLHGRAGGANTDTSLNWGPGKIGGALRCTPSNSVAVVASNFLNIGAGGSDFSVALWVKWESASYPNDLFSMRGHDVTQTLRIQVTRETAIHYTLATQNPTWETGVTKAGIGRNKWAHVAFVKAGREVRIFIDGKLELRETLKAPTANNSHGILIGGQMSGFVDDVRLYKRALRDREAADLAGTTGTARMTATPTSGEAPLAVEFSCPESAPGTSYLWEFGDGETAVGPKARHNYRLGGARTAFLTVTETNGRVAVARQKIEARWTARDEALGRKMERLLAEARPEKPSTTTAHLASAPNVASDDYALLPPTDDPLGLKKPVWSVDLPGARLDCLVYAQPLITKRSAIFRHKNILYCYSLLSGQLRWKNDLGGRVTWQNWSERQFAQEDIMVQDGMVFTPMFKVGPTLVAIDEVTGQLKWAYGPMVASTPEEARMRFETAPAGGPGAVYAGYVLDNIEGMTHTDTEYGIIAFESATGRVLWRREICRLRPGKFSAGFAVKRRNLIRSFLSPPLYKEGTVYYCSNAGALGALDALSGRIKWVMRYPYHGGIHDATREFGAFPGGAGIGGGRAAHSPYPVYAPSPMLWYNQRPLLLGDDLYVLPVDADPLFKIDRRTGKVLWQKSKGEGIQARRTDGGWSYFLGATAGGELAIAYSFRAVAQNWAGPYVGGGVHLIDPLTGKTVWELGDWVKYIDHPFLTLDCSEAKSGGTDIYAQNSRRWPQVITARPFMSSDGRLNFGSLFSHGYPHYGWEYNLAVVDLNARTIEDRRRYVSGEFLKVAEWSLKNAPDYLKRLEDVPHKDDRIKANMGALKAIIERGTIPANEHGPFMPFSRVTAERFGAVFELRMGPRTAAMVYDQAKVVAALAGKTDPDAIFARAELAIADGRLKEAAGLIQQCLALIPAEDTDFRIVLNQQLYPIHKELARAAVRAGKPDAELAGCVGMSQTVGTLADEMEALLALSEGYERQGDWKTAIKITQNLMSRYAQYEYATSSLQRGETTEPEAACSNVLSRMEGFSRNHLYDKELSGASTLLRKGMSLYFGALSPLSKDLKVRAGELGASRLIALQERFPASRKALNQEAEVELGRNSEEEQATRLWEYAGTETARKRVEALLATTGQALRKEGIDLEEAAALRLRRWALADAARLCGVTLPENARAALLAPERRAPEAAVTSGLRERHRNIEEERGPEWLLLDRRDDGQVAPDRIYLGGRVKTKVDNKFLLYCLDARSGEVVWRAQEQRGETWFDQIRLMGKGDEPGFFEAFVHQDTVVVHGFYDVLAFRLADGKLKWRYSVPFAFEIVHAVMNGDLLVLAGETETVALYLGTDDPRGEVVWQEKEEGNVYSSPYFHGDRLVSLRKMPFNLTVRYRSTGKLMGRLELPDLLLNDEHPLVENGLRALPLARDAQRLVVSDGWYYILLDVEKMKVLWKRLIDASDQTRLPALRFELNGDYLAVVKQDFDVKALYMLSSRTGEVLWRTDAKVPNSPQPIDSMLIRDGRLYGIKPHAGQGFYYVGLDCKTGNSLFAANEQVGYGGKPEVQLRPTLHGEAMVAQIRDRQDFELKAFGTQDGKLLHTVKVKSTGNFGEHGRASATVQSGTLALLGKNDLIVAAGK